MARKDEEFDNPEAPDEDEHLEPHHREYTREEEGHEERIGALGDQDISTQGVREDEAEYLQRAEGLFTIKDPEELREALLNADEGVRNQYQFLKTRAGYNYRKAKEASKRSQARLGATAAIRVRSGQTRPVEDPFHLRIIGMRTDDELGSKIEANKKHRLTKVKTREFEQNPGTEGIVSREELQKLRDIKEPNSLPKLKAEQTEAQQDYIEKKARVEALEHHLRTQGFLTNKPTIRTEKGEREHEAQWTEKGATRRPDGGMEFHPSVQKYLKAKREADRAKTAAGSYDPRIEKVEKRVKYLTNVYERPKDQVVTGRSPEEDAEYADLAARAGVKSDDDLNKRQQKGRQKLSKEDHERFTFLEAARLAHEQTTANKRVQGTQDYTEAEVRRYHFLREKHLNTPDGLNGDEENEYRRLEAKDRAYNSVITRDWKGRTPHEAEKDRIDANRVLLPEEPYLPGSRRLDANVPQLDKLEPTRPKNVYSESGHEDTSLGFKEGWTRTHAFNQEQKNRTRQGRIDATAPITKNYEPLEQSKYAITSNKDIYVKTSNWEPIKPGKDFTHTQDEYTFRLEKFPTQQQNFGKEGTEYRTEGVNLDQALRDAGLDDKLEIGDYSSNDTDNPKAINRKLHTVRGVHLNPDEEARLKEVLDSYYGIVPGSFKNKSPIQWKNQRVKVEQGASTLPKGLKPNDIVPGAQLRPVFEGRGGANLGERDPITNELLPGESDRLGITIPGYSADVHIPGFASASPELGRKQFKQIDIAPRAAQVRLNYDTDAIGWGTSWRPGNSEISKAITAIPRAKQDRELVQKYLDSPNADLVNRSDYETDAEFVQANEVAKSRARKHLEELGGAAFASAYYTAKKGGVRQAADPAYRRVAKVPVVGEHVRDLAERLRLDKNATGTLRSDIDMGVRKPMAYWATQTKRKVRAPFSVLDENGNVARNESRITFDYHEVAQAARRRSPFQSYVGRQATELERTTKNIQDLTKTRESINQTLRNQNQNRAQRFWNTRVAGAEAGGWSGENLSDTLMRRVVQQKESIESALRDTYINGSRHKLADHPEYRAKLEKSLEDIKGIEAKMVAKPHHYDTEGLQEEFSKFVASKPPLEIPEAVIKGGKYGLAGAAIAGTAVLGTDVYQTYRANEGKDVNHRVLDALPQTISRPTVSVKRTQEVKLPKNTLTEFFDVENKKIPTAARVSVGRKQVAQLHHFKDVSGEGYRPNSPLLGGISLRAPAPVQGNVAKSFVQPRATTKTSKNLYIANRNTHIQADIGTKERWDNKRHKLKAKNPYKLSSEDRKHLLAIAAVDPSEEERLRQFYSGDKRFQESLDDLQDPEVRGKVRTENLNWLSPNSKNLVNEERSARDVSGTMEDITTRRRGQARARAENTSEYVG